MLLIGLTGGALFGQSVPISAPAPDQLAFFDHFFSLLGDPTQSPDTLQSREQNAALMFRFNQGEASKLHILAQQYLAAALAFNQSVLATTENKAVLSDSERTNLQNLNLQREQLIARLATNLLQEISPASAARFLALVAKGRP